MTIPVSGTYTGLAVYQVFALASLPASVQEALAMVEPLVAGSGQNIPMAFETPLATDAAVTFDGTSVSFPADGGGTTTLDDAAIVAQGPTAFGFASNGNDYVVSNGPLASLTTLDAYLSNLAQYETSYGDPDAAEIALNAKQTIDQAGYGSLQFITDYGPFTGAPYAPPCFARGTAIRTPDGDRAVETLAVGDRVVLARGGEAEIVWVGHRRVRFDAAAAPADLPVRIRAGALGDGLPRRDLVVSPDHALYLDGVLVPAGLLVDGETIRHDRAAEIEYFHVELARHDVLLAEGAAAESYLDSGNRRQFANCVLGYDPIDATDDPCADLVLAGSALDAIRARLALLPA